MKIFSRTAAHTILALVCACISALVLFSQPADAGLTAAGLTSDGAILISAGDSALQVPSTDAIRPGKAAGGRQLLAVGPGSIESNDSGTSISVLGQTITVDIQTAFPRGTISAGEYVAVVGEVNEDGRALASSIVRLGGRYLPGNSPVYLRGVISNVSRTGTTLIGQAVVDLSAAYHDVSLLDAAKNDVVEVLGVEDPSSSIHPKVLATSASVIDGINGSSLKGINGSSLKGINGSSLKGINGSSLKGINGSSLKGINGSSLRGINGSGLLGANGGSLKAVGSAFTK